MAITNVYPIYSILNAKATKPTDWGCDVHLEVNLSKSVAPHSLSPFIFRPRRLHAVHGMRPITTDVACSVVCVSVC